MPSFYAGRNKLIKIDDYSMRCVKCRIYIIKSNHRDAWISNADGERIVLNTTTWRKERILKHYSIWHEDLFDFYIVAGVFDDLLLSNLDPRWD